MEPTSRESLRRAVRRAVHHACWQRLEGDHAAAQPHGEIDQARAEHADADVPETEIRQWIMEDEAEFDRATLISELVARRVQGSMAQPAALVRPEPVRAESTPLPRRPSKDEAAARPPVRTAPSISSLLDDMLAQRSATAAGQA